MNRKSFTKDERFLLCLYETGIQLGDPSVLQDPFEIGQKIGLQERAVITISKTLLRANFIKKEDEKIYLTKHGEELVLKLLDQ